MQIGLEGASPSSTPARTFDMTEGKHQTSGAQVGGRTSPAIAPERAGLVQPTQALVLGRGASLARRPAPQQPGSRGLGRKRRDFLHGPGAGYTPTVVNALGRRSRLLRRCVQFGAFVASVFPAVASAADNEAPIQRPSRPAGTAVAVAQPAPTPEPAPALAATPAFTSSPAPTSAQAPAPRASATPTQPAGAVLHTTHESPKKKERLPHRGFVLDARIGAAGCLRSLCTETHRASPGLRLDGFVGGNIRGWVDLGISGGWGNYSASVETNANVLRLYGIEPAQLQLAANTMGNPLGFNPFALQVQSARLSTARVGPALRVHLIPRGRGIAYVGAGLGYSTFLADYDTAVGDVSLRFHGIDVPLQAGAGVQISEHLAAIVQFDYTFTNYPIARFQHPQQDLTLPVAFLDSAASASSGTAVSDSLPRSWGVGMGLRARF